MYIWYFPFFSFSFPSHPITLNCSPAFIQQARYRSTGVFVMGLFIESKVRVDRFEYHSDSYHKCLAYIFNFSQCGWIWIISFLSDQPRLSFSQPYSFLLMIRGFGQAITTSQPCLTLQSVPSMSATPEPATVSQQVRAVLMVCLLRFQCPNH